MGRSLTVAVLIGDGMVRTAHPTSQIPAVSTLRDQYRGMVGSAMWTTTGAASLKGWTIIAVGESAERGRCPRVGSPSDPFDPERVGCALA